MSTDKSNFKISIIEIVILAMLRREDMYGYQLVSSVRQFSGNKLLVSESTMYPTLYKLLKDGDISSYKQQTNNGRTRVYYHIEPQGADTLAELLEDYHNMVSGIDSILKADD